MKLDFEAGPDRPNIAWNYSISSHQNASKTINLENEQKHFVTS